MNDNEFLLFDRLNVIKDTINKYGEDNFYLSFSGGKDSTVVHYLLDMALPNNKIPRVYSNTGIEYTDVYQFVKKLAQNDKRIEIIKPNKNIKDTLNKVGYPFKNKEHSKKVHQYQATKNMTKYLYDYVNATGYRQGSKYVCPSLLRYQFTEHCSIKISSYCCDEFKKKPFSDYEKASGRTITITGMMREEGGVRNHIDCIHFKGNQVTKFHPLSKTTKEWEEWFIKEYNIELCRLYYEPFNFDRTGCKGCPYSLNLQEQLTKMEIYLPAERKQCEYIWKPVYEEYRRIGYRLKEEEQTRLF